METIDDLSLPLIIFHFKFGCATSLGLYASVDAEAFLEEEPSQTVREAKATSIRDLFVAGLLHVYKLDAASASVILGDVDHLLQDEVLTMLGEDTRRNGLCMFLERVTPGGNFVSDLKELI